MKKNLKMIVVTLCLIASLFSTPLSVWADVYDNVTENRPMLNTYPGEDNFLYAAEIDNDLFYSNETIVINDEHEYWVEMKVRNHTYMAAKDISIKPSLSQISENEAEVKVTISSSNAEPSTLTDTLRFTASESFHLEFLPNSTFVFSWISGERNEMIPDSKAESGCFPAGYYSLDGVIPGETYVDVFFGIRVVRDRERLELYTSKKKTVDSFDLLQAAVNPEYFLKEYHSIISKRYGVTFKGSTYKSIGDAAKKQTVNCCSDYEKMYAVCKYLAENIYYDYPYLNGKKRTTDYYPYDVWKSKKTVCEGYSALYWTMLDSLGIPSLLLHGEEHCFNAAYDRDSKRWVIIDVTWCSGNSVTDEGKLKKGSFSDTCFDISLDDLLLLPNHELYDVKKEALTVSKQKVEVAVGKSTKVKITVPQNTSLSISSKKETIATTKYNKYTGELTILAKKSGKTTLTIKWGSIKKYIAVTVKKKR